jgi:hypothetical protein
VKGPRRLIRGGQGVPEAGHRGVVAAEHLCRDHPLHLVPRRDAGQPGDDDGAHFVQRLLAANVGGDRGKGLRADVLVPGVRSPATTGMSSVATRSDAVQSQGAVSSLDRLTCATLSCLPLTRQLRADRATAFNRRQSS